MSEALGAAGGKVILLGEHAVVYGAPAIAAGIDQGASAKAWPEAPGGANTFRPEDLGEASVSALALPELMCRADPQGRSDLGRAYAALLEVLGAPRVWVQASSKLPMGGGLGSSAALGVAIARAVSGLMGKVDPEKVLAAADAWERVFHGNPSGIDTTAAALGGCFRYTRAEGAAPLAMRRELWLCVGMTGIAASTRTMVEGVARLFERRPEIQQLSIPAISALVENARLAIEAGDLVGLGKLMELNQMLLGGLMVSTVEIQELCALARDAGALGSKLTGAGGGGSMIALLDARTAAAAEDAGARVLEAWKAAGYQGFIARVGQATPAAAPTPTPAPVATKGPEA